MKLEKIETLKTSVSAVERKAKIINNMIQKNNSSVLRKAMMVDGKLVFTDTYQLYVLKDIISGVEINGPNANYPDITKIVNNFPLDSKTMTKAELIKSIKDGYVETDNGKPISKKTFSKINDYYYNTTFLKNIIKILDIKENSKINVFAKSILNNMGGMLKFEVNGNLAIIISIKNQE